MRSLLNRGFGEAQSAPPATPSSHIEASEPPEKPQAGPEENAEEELFQVTRRLAVAMAKKAEKDLLAPGDNTASLRDIMRAMEISQEFLTKLPKMRPAGDKEDDGVAALRAMTQDPEQVVERLIGNIKFQEALKSHGWLPPPPSVKTKPTKAQAAERSAYQERERQLNPKPVSAPVADDGDDAELQRLLKGGSK